jgi:glutamate/tyrosine decarboxylase-like PLP-dependent enzyme
MVIARNCLFPETKEEGNGGKKFVLFTSEHGHYSVEKAAQMFGFGSKAVRTVAVDEEGCMLPSALSSAIAVARERGETPFYVNATAGTTVLGSFDPLDAIADVCEREGLWLHVDGSWGGSVVFCEGQKWKLKGSERADSVAICAHKMLQVPLTCSFLLGRDVRKFQRGMTLPAGYLFHSADGEKNGDVEEEWDGVPGSKDSFYDLADLTPQCGRRGDSLKLALTWLYHGSAHFDRTLSHAFSIASHLADLISSNPKFTLVSSNPPPCLQVCFYYAKDGSAERNSHITEEITRVLKDEGGFMTDFAPGKEGKFFRVVVNGGTTKGTVEGLVRGIERAGERLGL